MSGKDCPVRLACHLPTRQQQVVRMIGEEKTTKEIALELGLSVKTIEHHRMLAMRRTGIYNQIGLAKLAIRLGMVTV